jgi:hypothetical protein
MEEVERSANLNIERMLNVFDLHLPAPEEKAVSIISASKTRRNLQTFGRCLQFKQSSPWALLSYFCTRKTSREINAMGQVILTLFYTCELGIIVLHVMVPKPYRFNLCFLNRHGNLTTQEFSFKWVKVMLPYKVGGGLPVVGSEGGVMTHTAGSVNTQSIAFKYVMASEPYRNTLSLKQVMAGLPYI